MNIKQIFGTLVIISSLSITGCSGVDNKTLGLAGGAAAGGIIGSAASGGNTAATIVGAAAGGAVGYAIGKNNP